MQWGEKIKCRKKYIKNLPNKLTKNKIKLILKNEVKKYGVFFFLFGKFRIMLLNLNEAAVDVQ